MPVVTYFGLGASPNCNLHLGRDEVISAGGTDKESTGC